MRKMRSDSGQDAVKKRQVMLFMITEAHFGALAQ
jgi:hypothetical protein